MWRRISIIVVLVLFLAASHVPMAAALSNCQTEVFAEQIAYFDCNPCESYTPDANSTATTTPDTSGSTTTTPAAGSIGPVYMLGDSITLGAKDELNSAFTQAKFQTPFDFSARVSRSFTSPGQAGNSKGTPNSYHNGLDQLDIDQSKVSAAGVVIMALGTNADSGSFQSHIKQAVSKIATASPNNRPLIYWVNVFSKVPQKASYNSTLNSLAASQGFTVIDANGANISLGPDGVHPDSAGQKKLASTIVNAITSPGTSNTGTVPSINTSYDGNKINPSSTVINDLLKAQAATGVPASVLLAQGAQESGNAGWWDKSQMDDTRTLHFSYFGGGKHSLNDAYASYDTNPLGHGPMQLDNWGVGGSTGNYNDTRFATFAKDAQTQFGAPSNLDPKHIGNIAMMWDTSILYAAIIDADILHGTPPSKATTDQWASVLATYGTLAGASSARVANWKSFRDSVASKLDSASPGGTPSSTDTGSSGTSPACCANGSSSTTDTSNQASASSPTQPSQTVPSNFTLKQKIGHLMFVGVTDDGTAATLEKKYEIGGFLLNSGASYTKPAISGITGAGSLTPLIALDEEGGLVDRLQAGVPSAEAMGQKTDAQVKQIGQDIGKKMANIGVTVDFGPVLDLNNGSNATISHYGRSFASSSDSYSKQINTIDAKAGAFAAGLSSSGVSPTFKHFPGLGRATGSTNGDTDKGPASTPSLSSLQSNDLKPYENLLSDKSSALVMVGSQTVPGLTNGQPADMSKGTYSLLRGKYSFNSVIVTDEIGHSGAISSSGRSPAQAVVDAIKAGADMPLFNTDGSGDSQVSAAIDAVANAVKSGQITTKQIDDSLNRVLQLSGNGSNSATTQASAAPACACPTAGSGTTVSLTGNGRVQQAFNFLTGNGLTAFQAAAIVGTMMEESGHDLDPNAYNSQYGAFGIAQWAFGRKSALQSLAQSKGTQPNDFATQLTYLWSELTGGYKSTLDKLKTETNLDTAVYDYEATFEVSGHQLIPQRQADARSVLHDFGGGATATGGGGGTTTSSTDCSGSNAASGIGGYKNPFRDVMSNGSLRAERIDMGVDYAGQGTVYALGDGYIKNLINTGWNYGGYDAFISEQLTDGPATGKYVYMAEACIPKAGLTINEKVTADTPICTMINPSSTGIETGWAAPPGLGDTMAISNGGYTEGYATAMGENYNDLLVKLGVPSGTQQPKMGSVPSNWPVWK